jgi:hypothetical protein
MAPGHVASPMKRDRADISDTIARLSPPPSEVDRFKSDGWIPVGR